MFYIHSGMKIRRIRKQKKIKTSELAKQCGVSEAEMRHFENGRRVVSDAQIDKIAEQLNVAPASLRPRGILSELDIIHTLFEIEDDGFIAPTVISDAPDHTLPQYGFCFLKEELDEAIQQWYQKRMLWENNTISDNEYQDWKNSFTLSSFENQDSGLKMVEAHSTEANTPNATDKTEYPHKSKNSLLFQSLQSRMISLSYEHEVSLEKQKQICDYVNCTLDYLNDRNCIDYIPNQTESSEISNVKNILFDLLDLMDKHTDTEHLRTIQIQLSRIVLYRIIRKGYSREQFRNNKLPRSKIDYLLTGKTPRFSLSVYGLYYTDLAILRELTGMSYQEMFTGIKQ